MLWQASAWLLSQLCSKLAVLRWGALAQLPEQGRVTSPVPQQARCERGAVWRRCGMGVISAWDHGIISAGKPKGHESSVNPALLSQALAHIPKCHIYTSSKSLHHSPWQPVQMFDRLSCWIPSEPVFFLCKFTVLNQVIIREIHPETLF